MTWVDVSLILSLVLNLLLAGALFFKGAVNEILAHWFKIRFIGRKERQRELLIELSGQVHALDRNYIAAVAPRVVSYHQPGTTPPSHAQNAAEAALSAVNDFLDRHTVEFPPSVRALIPELREAMLLKGFPNIGAADLLRVSNNVHDAAMRVVAEIERVIG